MNSEIIFVLAIISPYSNCAHLKWCKNNSFVFLSLSPSLSVFNLLEILLPLYLFLSLFLSLSFPLSLFLYFCKYSLCCCWNVTSCRCCWKMYSAISLSTTFFQSLSLSQRQYACCVVLFCVYLDTCLYMSRRWDSVYISGWDVIFCEFVYCMVIQALDFFIVYPYNLTFIFLVHLWFCLLHISMILFSIFCFFLHLWLCLLHILMILYIDISCPFVIRSSTYFNILYLWIFLAHLSSSSSHATSVTRLGDLLDFGQVFKAFGNN